MEDGKSSPCLLLPKYRRRKVSAVRDFPKGLKGFSDFVDLKSTNGQACGLGDEYLKAKGLHDTQFRKGDSIVDFEKQCGVAIEEVIHKNPKRLKRFQEDINLDKKLDESCRLKNAKEFKKSSEELDPNVQEGGAFGSKNAKGLTKSLAELDRKIKEDEACGSKNEFLKPIQLHEASIDYQRETDFEKGVPQSDTKQQCGNGEKGRVFGLKKNPFCKKLGDFSNSVNPDISGVKSWREEEHLESEQEVDQFTCLQKRCADDTGNVLGSKESMKCQDIGTSVNFSKRPGNLHRKLPKRRKVSAIRDFPPALVRVIPMSDGTTNNSSAIGHGCKKSENFGKGFETNVENKKDLGILKTDDVSHSKANEREESSYNSGKELLVDKVAYTDHLGMVECSCSDIVHSSDCANIVEPEYGINNVETSVENRFLINDEPRLHMENRESRNPSGHDSPAINDVQASSQLDAPDDMFSLAPGDVADFFYEDCHNGFIFEDYGEPSETDSQSAWQDGSEETAHDIGNKNHAIKVIAGSGDDDQRLQLNDIRKKTNKLSMSGKGKEDARRLIISQKKPSCKTAHGFSQQRFPSVGGSVTRDKAMKYRTGEVQAKKVQRGVIKLEGGGSRVGKVKYMPMKEAHRALENHNKHSVKIHKNAPMSSRVSENRVVVQGLMAAKRCPWRYSKR